MEELKFHLLDDFGVHKSNVKRNLDADYAERDDDWSRRVRALLDKPTEMYTLDEIGDLIQALSSGHDGQVVRNPSKYMDAHGRPSIEVWQSERTLERQAALEERLRNYRARAEHTVPSSMAFHEASLPPDRGGYAGTLSLRPPVHVHTQPRKPKSYRQAPRPPVVLVGFAALLAAVVLGFLLWAFGPALAPATPAPAPILPVATPVLAQEAAKPVSLPPCIDGMAIVHPLTLEDHIPMPTTIGPGQAFSLGWRVRNVGTCQWAMSFSANFAQGNVDVARMGGVAAPLSRSVLPGETYDINVQLVAPILPGAYQAWWEMRNAQGVPFGHLLYLSIQVPSPATPTPLPTQTPVPGIGFSADRTSIQAGDRVVLSWNVTSIKGVFLYVLGEPWEQRGVPGQGTRPVNLQNTTVYELRVVKPNDQIEF
jgi:hypothetical protein